MFVKVCGITTKEQIDWAIELGYSAIGFVTYKKSPRYVEEKNAHKLIEYAKTNIKTIVVSKSFDDVKNIESQADYIQIYEMIEHDHLIYAGTSLPENIKYNYFLYDASLGSGEFHEMPLWLLSIKEKLILSGGLTPLNVRGLIGQFSPFGVDVSSGVEKTRGIKDYTLMKEFIQEVHNAHERD